MVVPNSKFLAFEKHTEGDTGYRCTIAEDFDSTEKFESDWPTIENDQGFWRMLLKVMKMALLSCIFVLKEVIKLTCLLCVCACVFSVLFLSAELASESAMQFILNLGIKHVHHEGHECLLKKFIFFSLIFMDVVLLRAYGYEWALLFMNPLRVKDSPTLVKESSQIVVQRKKDFICIDHPDESPLSNIVRKIQEADDSDFVVETRMCRTYNVPDKVGFWRRQMKTVDSITLTVKTVTNEEFWNAMADPFSIRDERCLTVEMGPDGELFLAQSPRKVPRNPE